MRTLFAALYWAAVGALTILGVYLLALGNRSPYLLVAALALARFGAWRPELRYA